MKNPNLILSGSPRKPVPHSKEVPSRAGSEQSCGTAPQFSGAAQRVMSPLAAPASSAPSSRAGQAAAPIYRATQPSPRAPLTQVGPGTKQPKIRLTGPPVYDPYVKRQQVQAKTARTSFATTSPGAAPPVYRPAGQAQAKKPVLQAKSALSPATSRPMIAGIVILIPGIPRRVKTSW